MFENEPNLGRLRRAYDLRNKDPEGAVAEFEALAESGSVMSHAYLGEAFENGIGVAKDLSRAEFWYSKACDMGYVLGLFKFASRRRSEHNDTKAMELYKKCVEKDYLPSYYWLANLYMKHQNDGHDNIEKAKELLKIASSRGHVFAKRDLAVLMMKGYFGFTNRFKGAALYCYSVITGTIHILNDGEDELLK